MALFSSSFLISVNFKNQGRSVAFTNNTPVFGLTDAPPQLAPPCAAGTITEPVRLGGSYIPTLYFWSARSFFILDSVSGLSLLKYASLYPCLANGAGLVGKGCVGQGFSPGIMLLVGTGTSLIGNKGLPVTRSKINTKAIFVTRATASTGFPS